VTVFDPESVLPASVLAQITEARVRDPDRVRRAAASRRRRTQLTEDGRLNIVAADHPARGVMNAQDEPLAMAHRGGFLARVVRALQAADGVMATMDVLEDLLLLDDLLREAGGVPLLDDKLLIPSLNRGGLLGSAWELDDPMTGPDAEACAAWGMDGGKVLLRVNLDEKDSLRTLEAVALAVTELARLGLAVFLEPLPVQRVEGVWRVDMRPEPMAQLVGIAQALGESSRHTWLKLPYFEPFAAVAQATTLPILILGGASTGDPTSLLRQVAAALATGPTVRGALAGRNVLYPGGEDPLVAAEMIHTLVHGDASIEQAIAAGESRRGQDLSIVTQHLL
jgi:DhnA family fructose-bisphosphate aldolase class Ia